MNCTTSTSSPCTMISLANTRLTKRVLKAGFVAVAAMGAFCSGQAHAIAVNINGQQWDVTTFTGSYNENMGKFESPSNGGVMPWWGEDPEVISDFVAAVGNQLGQPNVSTNPLNPNPVGPFFAIRVSDGGRPAPAYFEISFVNSFEAVDPDVEATWAQATLASPDPTPVPSPLHALGVTTAFCYSRKLRKRITFNTHPDSFT
jgi:hypothetical protein